MDTENIDTLTLQEMRVFQLFIKTGAIAMTAKELNTSTSTCIRSINSMEEKLQTTLFLRIRNEYQLTEQAIKIYEPLTLAMRAYASSLNASNSWSKKIRLLMPIAPSFLCANYYLPKLKKQVDKLNVELITLSMSFLTEFPKISEIILDNIDLIILREGYDHFINPNTWRKMGTNSLVQKTYSSEKYLAENNKIDHPEDLTNHICILSGNKKINLWEFTNTNTNKVKKIYIPKGITVENEAIATHAVDGGAGIAILTEALVKGDERDNMVEILTDYSVPNALVSAYVNHNRHHKHLDALTEIIQQSFQAF
ncbi:LysR family transcriptional regulator [Francisellaceae bacterium]|nr:LysR family transcriptional regulator [Francisellaceae bacterium]